VVYDGVSKFFPVRASSLGTDRAELMVALDSIDATVTKGELITLLGPSGCGKTTLLRLTAGLIPADEGRITIAGTPVTGPRKGACMVLQKFRPAAVAHGHGQCRISARDRWRRSSRAPRSRAPFHRAGGDLPPLPSIFPTNCPAVCSSGSASRAR